MVTIEDISLELTKPAKHLADWAYPFSEALQAYYSLFNDTSNKGFSNAGLVLQNSTAVYVHRLNYLWDKTAVIRDIIIDYKKEDEKSKLGKKKDRNLDISFKNFEVINFAEVIDKNIDIKKDVMQESVKSKTRCFTQLEKGIGQSIPINIYDVNGEIIGKKYDFRCNQNMSTNGMLIDEFAPEDFDSSIDDSVRENSTSTAHDSSDKNLSTDEESEKNDHDSLEEASDLIGSLDSSQNLSSSNDSIADTTHGSTTDNQLDRSSSDSTNECQCTSHSDTNLPSNTVDSIVLSNNNIEKNVHDDNDQLDNTAESKNSQERIPSIDNATSLTEDVNRDAELSKSHTQSPKVSHATCMFQADSNACLTYIQQHNPLEYVHVTKAEPDLLGFRSNESSNMHESATLSFSENEEMVELYSSPAVDFMFNSSNSTRKSQSRRKRTPRTPKEGRIVKKLFGKRRTVKNKLQKENLERILMRLVSSERTDRSSMFQQNLNACMKYIQKYDPLRYDDMTDAASNFLGFRLRVVEACDSMHDDAKGDMTMTSTDLDDDTLRPDYSPITVPFSSEQHENSCDSWFQSDTPDLLPKNIEKWHEFLQPKLRAAERRSKFSIRQYRSRVIECLQTNSQCQMNFDDIIPVEDASEVARYFLASLDLASRQKVNLIRNMDLEHSIQIALYEKDTQYSHNDQADSHD